MQPTTTQDAPTAEAPASTLPDALALARRLATREDDVELQGSVVHRDAALTLAAGASVAAVLAMLGQLAVPLGVVLLLLVLLSLVRDLEGGSGWLRRLVVLKDIGHNVLVWRAPRLPDRSSNPPGELRPPWLAAEGLPSLPGLLIAIPADGAAEGSGSLRRVHLAVLGFTVLALIGLLVYGALASIAAGLLAVTGGWLLLRHLQSPPSLLPSPAIPAALKLMEALRESPPERLVLAFAFIEGAGQHHDGIETVLSNYRRILPPDRTRVLVLSPADQPLSLQTHEGVLQRQASDPFISAAADGLPTCAGVSGAARAMRLGWPAAALRGDLSDTTTLLALVHRLDAAAGARQW